MSVTVRIPTILRTYTQDQSQVPADGATLAELYALREGHGSAVEREPVLDGLYV